MGVKSGGCADGCESCPIAAAAPQEQAPYRGWRLGVVSLGYFIFPIVAAFVGARLAGPEHGPQALGALAGLAVGMGLAIAAAKRSGQRLAELPSRRGVQDE